MKKIKILKISYSYLWYKNKLNKVLDVVRETKEYYWCREDEGYLNIVHKQDAEELEVDNDNNSKN